jgi:3D (Asp-Asp-Asp) domain-containing protein
VFAQLLGISALFLVGFSLLWYGSSQVEPLPPPPVDADVRHAPVVVLPESLPARVTAEPPAAIPGDSAQPPRPLEAPLEPGRIGRGGRLEAPPFPRPREPGKRHPIFDFDFGLDKPLLLRRRLPVQVTMYCLKGTTRSGLQTRPGIVAADPRVLPLGTTIDLYVGLRYYGRYLVDDTGGVIKGAIIDVWTPDCTNARRFGRRRGAVVLVTPGKRRR